MLTGKRAVVTGATRGIGSSVAQRLCTQGAEVFGTGTRPDGKVPDGCSYMSADFAEEAQIGAFARELASLSPDILINCAGINKIGPFAEIAPADFKRIQQVNVYAPFRLCQAVIPAMRSKRWGRIVNVCSVWGKQGKELRASYSASKFALAGMTAALAAEVVVDGILANCVAPGPVETEMTHANLTSNMLRDLLATVPTGRLCRAEEVAALICWLAGPENTFIAGQNIAIDGGMTRA